MNRELHSVEKMCQVLKINPGSYYRCVKDPIGKVERRNRPLKSQIKSLFYKFKKRYGSTRLTFHSDRGVQYACDEFAGMLNKHQFVTRSMSRKGDCWDNAVAESFFKSLKDEEVYETVYQNQKEAEIAIFEYIEGFYNRNRRHSALGYLTVNEFEKLKHEA